MTTVTIKDACLLIASCDAYAEIARVTIAQIARMWPDCQMKQYVVVNEDAAGFAGVQPILVGRDKGWSANLRWALAAVPETYIFLYIDDLFLTERVNNQNVEAKLLWAMKRGANYLRLNPYPRVDKPVEGESDILAIPNHIAYRTATVMSFWRKQCLHDLLDVTENAWQFETKGSERARGVDDFFSTKEAAFAYYNLVVKGKLRRRAPRVLAEHGYGAGAIERPVLSVPADLLITAKDIRAALFHRIPVRYQQGIRELLSDNSKFDSVHPPLYGGEREVRQTANIERRE